MKKKLAIFLTVVLALGNLVTASAASVSFADINDVPWSGAATYINGAAEAGLMVGDTNTKGERVCRARDQVTYCETMQLAYSILKSSDKLGDTTGFVTKWQPVMEGYNIPSWAYESVAYGLNYNILSTSDVSRFMASATKNNYAKREDVAVIFGKALSVRTSYTTQSGATLSFGDSSKIASTSVPYIDLLNRLDIIVGDDSGNFNPRNDINRAEMSVVSLKTYNLLMGVTSGGSTTTNGVRGVISSINSVSGSSLIALETSTGSRSFLGVASSVKVTAESGGASYTLSDLTQGDVVTIYTTSSTSNDISSITVHSKVATTTVSGTIDKVSSSRIYLLTSSVSSGYDLADNYTVTLDGSSSTLKLLIEATDNYTLTAILTLNSSNAVTKIVATTTEGSGTSGTLKEVTTSEVSLKRSNTTTSYTLASSVIYKLDGETSTRSSVQKAIDNNTTVTGTLYFNDDDEVIRVYATTGSSSLEGVISSSISSSSFKIKIDSSTKTYYLASGCTFRLDGSTSSRTNLNTAISDYGSITAALTLDDDGDVTRIVATSGEGDVSGVISKSISTSSLTIKVSGTTKTYSVYTSCTYKLDGDTSSRSEINDLISDDGSVEAQLTLDSSDRVTKVVVTTDSGSSSTVKGTISSEMADSYLRIKRTGYTTTTKYYLTDDTKYTLDGSSSTWTKVNRAIDNNDGVYAVLTLDGTDVVKVAATTDSSSDSGSSSGSISYLTDTRIKVDGTSYDIDEDSTTFYLNGSTISLTKLIFFYDYGDEMDAEITTNSSDEVTKVKAYTRQTSDGLITGVYPDSAEITIRKTYDGTSYSSTYTIRESSCSYYIYGDSYSDLDSFSTALDKDGGDFIATLTLNSSGQVTKISADYK